MGEPRKKNTKTQSTSSAFAVFVRLLRRLLRARYMCHHTFLWHIDGSTGERKRNGRQAADPNENEQTTRTGRTGSNSFSQITRNIANNSLHYRTHTHTHPYSAPSVTGLFQCSFMYMRYLASLKFLFFFVAFVLHFRVCVCVRVRPNVCALSTPYFYPSLCLVPIAT